MTPIRPAGRRSEKTAALEILRRALLPEEPEEQVLHLNQDHGQVERAKQVSTGRLLVVATLRYARSI